MKSLFILIIMLALSGCATTPSNENPVAAQYNVRLGLGYLNMGERARARVKLLRALSQDPRSPTVELAMGYYLLSLGQTNQAEPYFERARELAPNSPEVQNSYGVYLCRTGHAKASIVYFLKAAKNSRYLHPAAAYENAGICALKLSERGRAERFFEQALRFNPSREQSLLEIQRLNRYDIKHGREDGKTATA